MKKLIALLLIAVLALSAAACSSQPADTQAPAEGTEAAAPADGAKVVKIGVFEPASGDNGAGGKQETLGVQYANKVQPTVEIGGETYNVELVIVDNESSNDKAPTAAANLVAQNVSIVLGSYGSGVSIAAGDVFNKAGIPAMGITCTNPQVTNGVDCYFRICFLDPFQGTVLANFASKEFGAKKAYCLSKLGDDYSGGLCHYFVEAFKALGGEVVEETFPEGNSDFTSYITTAQNSGAEVFFSPVSTEAAALIIDQAAGNGMTVSSAAQSVILMDVAPLSLSIETVGGVATKIIDRNTTIPTRHSQIFTTAAPFQTAVDIKVLQGERYYARDNKLLGNFRLKGIRRAMAGVPQIEVTFAIDANGIVTVSAKDLGTGNQQEITISSTTNMSEEEIRRAMEDARRYEAQDKARKEASGIRNEAEKLIYETEQALGRDKTISHEDKKKVKDDISALRKAVNKTKPESITTEQAAEIARLAEALKQSAKAIRTAE